MPWPQFTPVPTLENPGPFRPAADLLRDIIDECNGWLATHVPQPPPILPPGTPPPLYPATEFERWQRIRADASMDLANFDHHHLRQFVNPNGTAANNAILDTPWGHVDGCRKIVCETLPSMPDLITAIDFVDHLGGGGVHIPPIVTIDPPAPIVTGNWPDVGFGTPAITARRHLDAIRSHAIGQLLRRDLSPTLRRAYEKLVIEVMLDRSNVEHGSLRKYVKADGSAAVKNGLQKAWTHVAKAFVTVSTPPVRGARVNAARKLVSHVDAS